jgi:hypothetical protein
VLKITLLFLWLNLSFSYFTFAQTSIYGKVTDSLGKPVAFANVNLEHEGLVIAYTQTNKHGGFRFSSFSISNEQNMQVGISAIGFQKLAMPIQLNRLEYNAVLKESNTVLKEIMVTSRSMPIKKKGDTTNFDLSFYKQPQDRVIEDVLKKIPGIEISDAGKISYNGKSITTFYIDGDNLLDDKYTLGLKTIPSGIVDSLQVFENHQPIKALGKISPSENVSLNITINAKARLKLMGQANIGLGTDERFKEELNIMSLKKDYKTLNVFKYNSDGYDLSKDITPQNFSDRNSDLNRKTVYPLLDINTMGTPYLNQNKYLFNHALLASTNQLFKLKNEVQLKISGQYFNDNQRRNFSRLTQQLLFGDTIQFFESQNQQSTARKVELSGDVLVNKKKYYFSDAFLFRGERSKDIATVSVNDKYLLQNLNTSPYEFYNEAKYIKTINNNKAIEFSSFISKSKLDQELNVSPPVFNNYSLQNVGTPQVFINHSIALKISGQKFFQEYKLIQSYDEKLINSSINTHTEISELNNRLKWRLNRFLFAPSFNYVDDKFRLSLIVPLSYNDFNYGDEYRSHTDYHKLVLEPKILLSLNQGKENKINAQYQYKNDFGDASTQYQGYILSNYRMLRAYDTDFLSQSNTHNFLLRYNFSKSVKLFSLNIFGLYSVKENNSINQFTLNNFNQTTVQLPLINYNRNIQLTGNTNKYIFSLRTTLKASLSIQSLNNNQIVNGKLLPYRMMSYTYGFGTDTKLTDRVYLKYNGTYMPSKSRSEGQDQEGQENKFINQKMEFVVLPIKTIVAKLNLEHQYYKSTISNPSNYLFIDFSVNWKFAKARQELMFSAINLGNIKTFQTNYLSAYTATSSSYELLGRFFQINYIFNF